MRPEVLATLLKRIGEAEDHEAFQRVFEAFAPKIKVYLMREGADPATAEELTQEAMTSVWRKASSFSPEKGSATTWLFTVARNLRIDRYRRERLWQPLPEDYKEQASGDIQQDDAVIGQQRVDALKEALKTLPADQFELIRLSYMDGLPHSEISKRLDLPLGTVKSKISRAYIRLRPYLTDER